MNNLKTIPFYSEILRVHIFFLNDLFNAW